MKRKISLDFTNYQANDMTSVLVRLEPGEKVALMQSLVRMGIEFYYNVNLFNCVTVKSESKHKYLYYAILSKRWHCYPSRETFSGSFPWLAIF